MRRAVLIRRLAATALVVVSVGGCAGSEDRTSARRASFSPTAAAAAVRALGTVAISGHASIPGRRVGLGGRIGFRPDRVLLQVPVSSGGALTAVEYRRIGATAWVRRSVETTPGVVSFGVPLLAFRSRAQVPFVVLDHPDEGPAYRIAVPYEPARLFDALAGEPTIHFRATPALLGAHPESAAFRAELPPAARTRLGVSTVRVGLDRDSVPISVRVTTPDGLVSEYRIRRPKESAVAVASPPPSQVETTGRPLPDATEPYVPAQTATAGGVPVTVRRAMGRDGWTCFRVDSVPPYGTAQDLRPSGGVCVPPVAEGASEEDRISLPIDADATTPYELIGAVVPPGSVVSVELLGGRTQPVAVGPDGLAVYAGPVSPAAVLMKVVVPGGTTVLCAPGAVNGTGDLATAGSATVVRAAPWNCLPEDLAALLAG